MFGRKHSLPFLIKTHLSCKGVSKSEIIHGFRLTVLSWCIIGIFYIKKAVSSKDQSLWKEYQRARNTVNSAINCAKKSYYDNAIDNNKNDPRMMWKKINELVRDKKKSMSCNHGISASSFNEYFSNGGKNVSSKFVNEDAIKWKNPETIYSFEFVTIDEGSVITDLLTLNADSNNDVLQLDSKLLRLASPLISKSLTHLFNLSLISRVVPSDWKLARITPIYKGKCPLNCEANYRPLSVLSHVVKIFEKTGS